MKTLLKYLSGGIIFLFPTFIARLIINLLPNQHIGKHTKIGFSILICDTMQIGDNCRIGHLNIILCKGFKMVCCNKIKHLNIIKGYMQMIMEDEAWINSQNKISAPTENHLTYHLPTFMMKEESSIIMQHVFNVTDDITIGRNTIIAGVGTQFWTHSFYVGRKSKARVDGTITIGDYCYIGARSVICAGVIICNDVALGAGTIVSKNIENPGLYVSQPMRFIEFDGDKAIKNLEDNGIRVNDWVLRKQ